MSPAPAHKAYRDVMERAAGAVRSVAGAADVTVRVRRMRSPQSAEGPMAPADAMALDLPNGDDLPRAQVDGAPLLLPDDAPGTLTEALLRAAREVPDRGTTYVLADDSEEIQTYSQLLDDAARILPGLRACGLRPGESVLLHCDDNRNFVTGFWACLLGGFVPTPIGMAPGYHWENATTRRIRDAWELLGHPPVLTDAAFLDQVAQLRRLWSEPGLVVLAAEKLRGTEPARDLYPARPDDPAVHLLTSGSTGVPKCVRHSHRTVVTRAFANAEANGFGADDVTLNFMPLDHVAGMTMHNLRDVILQCEHVNARTDSFLGDPLSWLTWIERHRVTNTSAPNFVVTLVVSLAERIAQGKWDLSTLRDITNGGEAIVSRTMHEFLRLLAPHGMAPDVMRPAWGMSEMCGGMVHSTLRGDNEKAGVVTVDNRTMNGILRLLPGPAVGHPTFTEVGVPIRGTSVRIVDAHDSVVSERRIGRLQVRGVTRMTGYHNNPEANEKAYTADGWFDTGDLAFIHDGRLVMTGREKDLIVVRSANYPCHEIESIVERVDGVLPTFVAAASEHDSSTGTDELMVFCALETDDVQERRAVIRAIGTALSKEIGLRPRTVVPVRKESFPKTSAGKLQRGRLLAQYRDGAYDADLDVLGLAAGPTSEGAEAEEPWLFEDVWTASPGSAGTAPAGTWLVLGQHDLAAQLRDRRGSGTVVAVSPGRNYERISDTDYRINPEAPADYAALRVAVERDHGPVGALVHAWATGRYADRAEAEGRGLELAALSVHSLVKAFASQAPCLLVVTTAACTDGVSDPVEPVHATVNGLVRTVNAEHGGLWIRQLDLSYGEPHSAALIEAELADTTDDELVAYRQGRRLTSRIRPLGRSARAAVHRVRQGGLYLLTGGLGGIGLLLSRHLLTVYKAKVVLLGRTPVTGEHAEKLAGLAQLGDVTYYQGDVADVAALRRIVTDAERRCDQPLDGVVHLAGADISGYWQDVGSHLLPQERAEEFRSMYHAKVLGTHALAAVLEDRLDTALVLFSSVNGHFGGTAFGAYASASSFLPAFARYWRRLGRPVQCQQWSLWAEEGENSPGAAAVGQRGFRRITGDYGVRLFTEALSQQVTNVIIGLDDSNEYIAGEVDAEHQDGFEVIVVPGAGTTASRRVIGEAVALALKSEDVQVRVTAGRSAPPRDARPQERPSTVALVAASPRQGDDARPGDLEDVVAGIWAEVLGRHSTDREAHFFELGGNSMKAIQLVNRLNTALTAELTVQQLYDYSTIRELAVAIRRTSTGSEAVRAGSG